MNKPLPKSLHTVTVLVKVARLRQQLGFFTPDGKPSNDRAVHLARIELGLGDRPDDYALMDQALKLLDAMPPVEGLS